MGTTVPAVDVPRMPLRPPVDVDETRPWPSPSVAAGVPVVHTSPGLEVGVDGAAGPEPTASSRTSSTSSTSSWRAARRARGGGTRHRAPRRRRAVRAGGGRAPPSPPTSTWRAVIFNGPHSARPPRDGSRARVGHSGTAPTARHLLELPNVDMTNTSITHLQARSNAPLPTTPSPSVAVRRGPRGGGAEPARARVPRLQRRVHLPDRACGERIPSLQAMRVLHGHERLGSCLAYGREPLQPEVARKVREAEGGRGERRPDREGQGVRRSRAGGIEGVALAGLSPAPHHSPSRRRGSRPVATTRH